MNKTISSVLLLCVVAVCSSGGCAKRQSALKPPTTPANKATLFVEWTWDFSQQTSLGALLGLDLSGKAITDTPDPKMVSCFGSAASDVPCYPSGLATTTKLITPGPQWSGTIQIDNAQPGQWSVSATALNGNQASSPQVDGTSCNVTVSPGQRVQLTIKVGLGRGCLVGQQ